jgi:hypothetical protein
MVQFASDVICAQYSILGNSRPRASKSTPMMRLLLLLASLASIGQIIASDTSPSYLPPTNRGGGGAVGKVVPRQSSSIVKSKWSIGLETQDRNYTVWDSYHAYVGPLGAKRGRLQV